MALKVFWGTFISMCFIALLVSCNANQTNDIVNNGQLLSAITYFKDVHGLCYASISSRTYGLYNVVSITNVPCDKVGL
jgi:hypothetical protein